jgi:hypothetical protein
MCINIIPISLTSDNNTKKNGCPICRTRQMVSCSTCYLPKCGRDFCKVSSDPCTTCQEINTPTPDTLEIDIPSANLHVMGLDFVECISGVRMIPRIAEIEDENTDPQTDPDIQFKVRVKGWSDLKQQNRAKTLLTLSDKKMVQDSRWKGKRMRSRTAQTHKWGDIQHDTYIQPFLRALLIGKQISPPQGHNLLR